MRAFNVICPFCEDIYPFPDSNDRIYKCRCGAVYKITRRHDMEDAVDQLAKDFLKDEDIAGARLEDDILCHVVVYEDIQDLIKMKMEYEAAKYIRPVQSFEQDYPSHIGLVWMGNYQAKGKGL